MKIEDIEDAVIDWAEKRGIFAASNPQAQLAKTVEELGELAAGIARGDRDRIKDGIGDVIVTLVIQADMHDLSLRECLATAWGEIKDRNGRMADGLFVKDGD